MNIFELLTINRNVLDKPNKLRKYSNVNDNKFYLHAARIIKLNLLSTHEDGHIYGLYMFIENFGVYVELRITF